MKAKLSLALLSLTLLALPWLVSCGVSPATGPLHLVQYYEPGCPVCASTKPAIAALAREFPGKVDVQEVDATSPEGAKMVRSLEFRSCGLVLRGHRGEVLWKAADHQGGVDDVREALRGLTAQPSV